MSKNEREEWLKDVEARQRNVVFPETAANEARFWRNLIASRNGLTVVQKVGVLAVFAVAACTIVVPIAWQFRHSEASRLSDRLLGTFAPWCIGLVIFLVLFLILRWGVRRSLASGNHGRSKP